MVRRNNESDVNLSVGCGLPHSLNTTVLDDLLQLLLQHARHALDFIQKHRSAIRDLKQAWAGHGGTGKRTPFMAEESCLQGLFMDSRAADLLESTLSPAKSVNGLCDTLLAGSGLAIDQYA